MARGTERAFTRTERDAVLHLRGTKTEHADRTVDLPGWCADVMRRRVQLEGVAVNGFVFPAPRTGQRRDRRNTTRAVRGLLDDRPRVPGAQVRHIRGCRAAARRAALRAVFRSVMAANLVSD